MDFEPYPNSHIDLGGDRQDRYELGSYKMSEIIYGRSQPSIITNERGMATQGFIVEVSFPEFDEIYDVRVDSLEPDVVKAAAERLYDQRAGVLALNEPEKE